MDSFSDKLKMVLQDPAAMETITSLAKNFAASSGGGSPAPASSSEKGRESSGMEGQRAGTEMPLTGENNVRELMRSPAIAEALRLLNDGSRERVALLQAMRPFVREEKRAKLDHIIQTMKLLDLIGSAQKLI